MPDEHPTCFRIAGEQPPIPVGTAVNLSRPNGHAEFCSILYPLQVRIGAIKWKGPRRRRTEGAELDEKIETTIADPANDPEVALQEKDRGELVRRALMRLSTEHREVIDLVYYHEKSVDEVARILAVPPATVKTRMFYARRKLAELVNGAEQVRC